MPMILSVPSALAAEVDNDYSPQAVQVTAVKVDYNLRVLGVAPSAGLINLFNIHMSEEHKGPRFSVSGGLGDHVGWKCNGTE